MTSPDEARALDRADPLGRFRTRFFIPPGRHGDASIYLAGHSLGLEAFEVRRAMEAVLDDWAELGVRGWAGASVPWTRLEAPLSGLAAPLVGAGEHEVCVTGTLTGNLHALLTSFYRPTSDRSAILVESRPFPSDRYALASHVRFHGFDPDAAIIEPKVDVSPGSDSQESILSAIERHAERLALVLVAGVNFYSGEAFDLETITRTAHAHGITVGLDLAHAVGNIPLALHDTGADFAVWCGYKYLNGGPGAPGGLFVHERHHDRDDLQRLAGWWGHRLQDRFQMPDGFAPERGAAGWQISTPSVLALAPLQASLGLFADAGLDALRAKSVRLTGYLERLLSERLAGRVEILTPHDPARRGAQLSLRIAGGGRHIFEHLTQADVVCDWREPDVIRVAPAPLYNTFDDVRSFVDRLATALDVQE